MTSAHGRWRLDIDGIAANSATTPMADRADPMLTFAMTALAANKQARLAGQRAVVGEVEVTPGEPGTVPARVTGWLHLDATGPAELTALFDAILAQARHRAERDGTRLGVTPENA